MVATIILLIFLPELTIQWEQASSHSITAAIFLGAVPSSIGQWLWSYGLSRTTVVKASTYLYAMPLVSTMFGWLILQELPSSTALAGGLIALFGSMLVKKDVGQKSLTLKT